MFRWKNKQLSELDKTKLMRNSGSYLILVVALGAMTFFGVCDPTSQTGGRGPSGSAAVVDSEAITPVEFRRVYSYYLQNLQGNQAEFDPATFGLSQRVLDYLVAERIAYQQATKHGLRASDAEVEKIILSSAERFKDESGKFSPDVFKNFLRSNGFTEASYMEEVRRDLSVRKLEDFIRTTSYVPTPALAFDQRLQSTKFEVDFLKIDPSTVNVEVTDADVQAFLDDKGKEAVKTYFDTHQSEFNTPEQAKARHILVGFKGARNASPDAAKRSKDEARKLAESISSDVKKSGADFSKVASAKTDEASGKTKGGDLGWFQRETMVKEFSDAAFALKPGQISDLVESPFGFHIIKLDDKKQGKSTSLEDATPVIARQLVGKDRKPKLVEERAKKIIETLNAKRDASSLLKEYGLSWQSTGEFTAEARSVPKLGADPKLREAVYGLSTPGSIHPEPVAVGDSRYVLRLKSVQRPSGETELKDADQQRNFAAYTKTQAIMGALRSHAKDELEKDGDIWMNPDYLAFDRQVSGQADGG